MIGKERDVHKYVTYLPTYLCVLACTSAYTSCSFRERENSIGNQSKRGRGSGRGRGRERERERGEVKREG